MPTQMPQPPAGYYEELGRLAAVAALAELELGLCGQAAESGHAYTTDWAFANSPGGAARTARERLGRLDPDHQRELQSMIEEFGRLVEVRHRAVHSVLSIDAMLTADEQWRVESPRDGETSLVELVDSMREARAGLQDLARRADKLRHAIAARRNQKARDGARSTT